MKKKFKPEFPALTPEQAQYKADVESAEQAIEDAEKYLANLLTKCKHVLPKLSQPMIDLLRIHDPRSWDWDRATCMICSDGFGFRCPDSPDSVCHYFTDDEGRVKLIDGSRIPAPAEHDREYETTDSCIFCGAPEERK
jgi:hypothetical protein